MRIASLFLVTGLLVVLAGGVPAEETTAGGADPTVAPAGAESDSAPAAMGEAAETEEPQAASSDAIAPESASSLDAAGEPGMREEAAASADADAPAGETAESGEATAEGAAPPAAVAAVEPGESKLPLGPIGYDAEGRPGRIHVVRRGDTLWDISEAYLGTPWVWPSIWNDNPEVANPHRIYPGDRIWITPTEMRRVSAEEAERLLGGEPLPEFEPLPAAIGEPAVPRAPTRKMRWSAIAGYVTNEDLDAAASILGSPRPVIWYAQEQPVYVGLGEGEARVGDRYDVVRAIKTVKDLVTGEPLGVYVEKLGWIEITEVHPESSIATVRQSFLEMRDGDKLLPHRVRDDELTLRDAPPGVEGRIVYMPDNRTTVADSDVVFLNRGADHGLESGHTLEVYRPEGSAVDPVRQARLQLPDDIVGRLLVVDVQPSTSVAVVTQARTELVRGDRFRGRASSEPQ